MAKSMKKDWNAGIEEAAKLAEETETWRILEEKTDNNSIYTGEYEFVTRRGPKWRDGKAIAAAIRKLKR